MEGLCRQSRSVIRIFLPVVSSLTLALPFAGCASAPPVADPSRVEVVFSDSRPKRPYEELGPVVARHWDRDEGILLLQRKALELGADVIVGVEYREFHPESSPGPTAGAGARDAHPGYGQMLFEFTGIAAVWADQESADDS